MQPRFVASLLAAVLATAAVPAQAAPAGPVTIPLSLYLGQQVSLEVQAGGHAAHFLLDTAGGLSVVTPAFASTVGCRPWGQITGFRMRGDRIDTPRCDRLQIRAAGVDLVAPSAGVWDFSKLLPKDAPPLAGSLALDVFAGRTVTLDIAGQRLIIETPASLKARIRHAREVPVRLSREAQGLALTPLAGVETSQGRLWMELDSGSDGQVIVNRPVASALGLDPTVKGGQPLAMTLAGEVPVQARAQVQDLIIDGNIGAPVLRKWVITLDLARGRMWIAPAG